MEILSDVIFKGSALFWNGAYFSINTPTKSKNTFIDNSEFSFVGGNFYSDKYLGTKAINFSCLPLIYDDDTKIVIGGKCGKEYLAKHLFGGPSEFGSGSFYLPQVDENCTKFTVSGNGGAGNLRFCNRENSLVGYQVKNVNTNEQVILKSVDLARNSNISDYRWSTEFVVEKNQGMAIPANTYKVTVFGAVKGLGASGGLSFIAPGVSFS